MFVSFLFERRNEEGCDRLTENYLTLGRYLGSDPS